MEKLRPRPTCLCIVILLFLLSHASAQSTLIRSVSLSPFRQWRNAYECTLHVSPSCQTKDQITLDGVVTVNQTEVGEYCRPGGCVDHIYDILSCILYSKRDFWFENKITVKLLNDTIAEGCETQTAFTTANYTSSAIKTYKSLLLSSAAAAVVTLTLFNL